MSPPETSHRITPTFLIAIVGCAVLLLFPAWEGLVDLWARWNTEEAYSHGMLIPPIALYLLWRRRDEIARESFKPSWLGVVLAVFSLAVLAVASIAEIFTLIQYAVLGVLSGLTLAVTGWRAGRFLVAPMLLLLFAIPLPYTLQVELTSGLQLLSSQLGVLGIRALGIPVHLEGNVIDLGVYRLQVVEACSGLNYLYPLLGVAFICASLFDGPLWKRIILVAAAVPITIAMNAARIGSVGILVKAWGSEAAEGFVHDFQGWVVFLLCTVLLVILMAVLARIGRNGKSLVESLDLELDFSRRERSQGRVRTIPATVSVIAVAIVAASIFANNLGNRPEIIPSRISFALFPTLIGDWVGRRGSLTRGEIDTLQLDDYVLASYQSEEAQGPVEFYVAYYESQRSGTSPHSPKVCLPGGGWEISQFDRKSSAMPGTTEVNFNRALMQKGDQKLLVYYWFQQRGVTFANEYLMKWHLFRDGLLINRTDGSLVRLTTPVIGNDAGALIEAEQRLQTFLGDIWTSLPRYVPS